MTRRGTDVEDELKNAQRLLDGGAEDVWGWGTPAGQERVRRRVDFIRREAQLEPGRTVLELGCGTGMFTRPLAESGARIVAVDVAQSLVEVARREVKGDVEFVVGDLMDPATLQGRTFDAFYCVSVLHHLDLDRVLPILAQHMRPGARFAVSEPNIENPLNRYWYYTDDPARRARMGMSASEMAFTKDELVATLARYGFDATHADHRDFLHPSTPRAAIPWVQRLERVLEATPGLGRFSGSLWCSGRYKTHVSL